MRLFFLFSVAGLIIICEQDVPPLFIILGVVIQLIRDTVPMDPHTVEGIK